MLRADSQTIRLYDALGNSPMCSKLASIISVVLTFSATPSLCAGVIFLGPTPYLSAEDSPFDLSTNFYLEDFEDGALNTPGVSGDVTIKFGFPIVDSVDADDGTIDGLGLSGHSAIPRGGACTGRVCYTGTDIEFTEDAFGRLPNAFGFAWTDGYPSDFFIMSIYDELDSEVGEVRLTGLGDEPLGSVEGSTSEDRFLGAVYGRGIRRVSILQGGRTGYLEFDHLQYGAIVPEPSAGCLLGISLIAGRVALMVR